MDARAPAPAAPILPDVFADVSVWRVDVSAGEEPSEAALDDLSDEEFERLARFRLVGDRARFAAVRSAVRRRLGAALGLVPREVPIVIDARGKPRLPGDVLWFSAAHSGDHGMVAISPSARVGVDIEATRDVGSIESLAALALSPSERRNWDAEPRDVRRARFFRAWTAKEALLKAFGSGLLNDPADLSVLDGDRLAPRGAAARLGFDPADAIVRPLPAPPGYAAALAVLAARSAPARRRYLQSRHP